LGLRELGSLRGARVGTGSARGGLAIAKRFGRFYRSLNPTHTCRQGVWRSIGTTRSPKGQVLPEGMGRSTPFAPSVWGRLRRGSQSGFTRPSRAVLPVGFTCYLHGGAFYPTGFTLPSSARYCEIIFFGGNFIGCIHYG
jgi:hypothetical protein